MVYPAKLDSRFVTRELVELILISADYSGVLQVYNFWV